jgi:DNA-binding CsgD family transcriptional regulator
MKQSDYLAVSEAGDLQSLQAGLVAFAHKMDFGLISTVMMSGDWDSPDVRVRSVSNTPRAYEAVSQSIDAARADPVLQRLMRQSRPFFYDPDFYGAAGAGDQWDLQSPFGYRYGLAVALNLPNNHKLLVGVDRPEALPKSEEKLTRMMADLQLLAVHVRDAAERLMPLPPAARPEAPKLTDREIEVLRWTMRGKSASVTAQILGIAKRTVDFHAQAAMKKLGVATKHQAVMIALSRDLL